MGPTKKLVLLSVLTALAVALHTLELLIPYPFPIPGIKLGLANIVTLVTLAGFGFREGMAVALLRVIIGSFLGGAFLGLAFLLGLSGAVFSTLIMYALMRYSKTLSIIGISVAGSAAHNLAQVTAAAILTHTPFLFYYLPILILAAIPAGYFTGVAAKAAGRCLASFYRPQE